MNIGLISTLAFNGAGPIHVSTDYAFAWGTVRALLQSHPINMLNPQQIVYRWFKQGTDDIIKLLQSGNISVINLANDLLVHETVHETLDKLKAGHITTVGIGLNLAQAQQPAIIKKNDTTIGIIGFSNKKEYEHTSWDQGGIFYVPFGDVEPVKELIEKTKEQVDILITLVQWGSEKPEPDDNYKQFAHALVDAGADIVHGESDHVYLGVEKYNDKLIIYDSGDFVELYLTTKKQSIPRSFIYTVELEKSTIKQVQLTPILLQERQLQKAMGQNKIEAINLMQQISKNLGTTVSDDGLITF